MIKALLGFHGAGVCSRLLAFICWGVAGVAVCAAANLDTLDEKEFRDPPLSARPGAFWPWLNGNVSLRRISYELAEMKAKGMSGADIWDVRAHADPDKLIPAGPPFLGPESLDAIAHTIREADRLGLRLGMIAASGWNAGGTWVTPPDAGMGLFHSQVQVTAPVRFAQELPFPVVPPACPKDAAGRPILWKEVAVLAIPSATQAPAPKSAVHDLHTFLDSSGKLNWDVPPGQWEILRFIMANTGHQLIVPSPNSGGPMIDFLNPDSSRRHFQYIVDRLESKVGNLGKSSLKYLEVDSMELGDELAWTGQILREFRKQHGYEPLPYLPVLVGRQVTSEDVSQRFLYDWRKTVSDVFIESHYRGGRRLLNRHGLRLCAEAGGPGAPIWSSCPVEALKALGAVDILRGEFWPKHRNMWLVKEIASAAHIYGKGIVDAESFTSWRHWQDGPYYLKQLADNALAEGLNHFTFHTFTHSPDEGGLPGFAYHAGTHINPNVVWWPMARPFIDYLARCSWLLQQGRFVGDVCFYYGDQAPNFVPSKHAGFSPGQGYDYDVVNSDVILNRFKVRDRRLVLPDGLSYAVLVLPERDDMDLAVLRKLESLVREGATVLGPKPVRTGTLAGYPDRDREVARVADRLWGKCDGIGVRENAVGKGRVLWNRPVAEVLAAQGLSPDFSYRGTDDRTRLDYVHRQTRTEDIYFINNRNERWEEVECLFRVKGKHPQLWHPETGAVSDVALYKETEAGTRVPVHLAPAESVFVVFRKPAGRPHWTGLESTVARMTGIKPALSPHSATPAGPMWLSDGGQEVLGQFITFDLGAERSLQKIRVWNYNENVRGYINYGVKDFDLLVSSNGPDYRKAGSFTLREGSENEDRNYWQELDLKNVAARYVRFEVKSNHNRPNYLEGVSRRVGLSRIEFFGPDKLEGVRIHSLSSGQAFDPATDDDLGNLHLPAELVAAKGGASVLKAWEPGAFVLHRTGGTSCRVAAGPIPSPLSIAGPWTVSFPAGWGAPESSRFEQLVSWTDRSEPGIKCFSGIATYRKSFELPKSLLTKGVCLELDLGVVQHVARVTLNGKLLGILWKPPFCLDFTEAARPGLNELVVEMANTWNNRLVGDAAAPNGERFTRTNLRKQFSPDLNRLQPSGLLGPVRVLFAREVPIEPSMSVNAAPRRGQPLELNRGEIRRVATVADLKTALEAANRSRVATTLLLADGTYFLDVPGLEIRCPGLVIRSGSGNREAVILRGPNEGPNASVDSVFLVSANDVVIADLTLGYCRHHGIQVRGEPPFHVSGLRVHNCRIRNCNQQFIKGSSSESDPLGATDGCIEQCLFEFTSGWAYQSYTGGIDIHKGVNWVVRDNLFQNLRVPAGQPGIAEHAIHFWKRCSSRSQNIVVERNRVLNCDRGIGFGLSNAEGGLQGGMSVIRNNMVFNDGTGPHTDVGIGLECASNVHVDNNTVVIQKYWAPMEYRFAGSSNVVFRNNLTSRPIQRRDDAPVAVQANNVEHVEPSWFRHFAAGDLRLTADARTAIDTGAALGDFHDDMDRRPRPKGSGWDIGACEFDPTTSAGTDVGAQRVEAETPEPQDTDPNGRPRSSSGPGGMEGIRPPER